MYDAGLKGLKMFKEQHLNDLLASAELLKGPEATNSPVNILPFHIQ